MSLSLHPIDFWQNISAAYKVVWWREFFFCMYSWLIHSTSDRKITLDLTILHISNRYHFIDYCVYGISRECDISSRSRFTTRLSPEIKRTRIARGFKKSPHRSSTCLHESTGNHDEVISTTVKGPVGQRALCKFQRNRLSCRRRTYT